MGSEMCIRDRIECIRAAKNYPFVFVLIRPTRQVLKDHLLCILYVLTRLVRLESYCYYRMDAMVLVEMKAARGIVTEMCGEA